MLFLLYHFLQQTVEVTLAKQKPLSEWGIFSNSEVILKRKQNKLTHTLSLTPCVGNEARMGPPGIQTAQPACCPSWKSISLICPFSMSTAKQNQDFNPKHSAVLESWCLLKNLKKKKKLKKNFFKHNLKLPLEAVFGLGQSFPRCSAKCDELQSLGQDLGRQKPTAVSPNAVGYQDWGINFCQRNVTSPAKCHSCPHYQPKRPREWHPEWGSTSPLPCFPAELHRRAVGPWGQPSLFLGADGFLLSEKEQFCAYSWFLGKEHMQFPTLLQRPAWNVEQPWFNSSGKCTFRGRRRFLE